MSGDMRSVPDLQIDVFPRQSAPDLAGNIVLGPLTAVMDDNGLGGQLQTQALPQKLGTTARRIWTLLATDRGLDLNRH